MHNAIAHQLLSDAQPVPEQQPPTNFPSSLYTEGDAIQYRISFWSAEVSCPGCPVSPNVIAGMIWEVEKSLT